MRTLEINRDAVKFIQNLQVKPFRQVMGKILELLVNPLAADSISMKGSDYANFRRVDCGEFRVVYTYSDETVAVIVVGKRNDDEVYRNLKRKV